MKEIYIDTECKCHVANPNGIYRAFQTDFFNGKCDAYIEGYVYVPEGEVCGIADGIKIQGKAIVPWKPHDELDAAQAQYELDMAEATAAYQEGVDSAYDQ